MAALASFAILTAGGTASGAPKAGRKAKNLLVAFRGDAPLAARKKVIEKFGLESDGSFHSPHAARLHPVVRGAGTEASLAAVLAELRKDPAVRVAEPDYEVHALGIPNDPGFSQLWGLRNTGQTGGTPRADISATTAWDTTTGNGSVIVAVIDTGVDYNHPDLQANILRDGANKVVGYDFANNDADPMDDNEHGTHCAGTIGAVGNNGTGVVGVCPSVKIMPMKFLAGDGSGSTSDAIKCIDWAREKRANVMSNSWGGGGSSQLLLEAIQRAEAAGILFTAAAGNDGANNDTTASYPANYRDRCANVVSVAASDDNDSLADFSNYGSRSVDIAAPGVGILSTTPGGSYSTFSGTSMATPHVSGAAALILSQYPGLSLGQLKARLLNTVDYPAAISGKVITGRLNVNAALMNDAAAPGAPSGFTVTHRAATGLRLSWTASGDDGAVGTAKRYEVRYSTTSITDANFAAAALASGIPAPAAAGTAQIGLIGGLKANTAYYVAIRAFDKLGNASPVAAAGPVSTLAASSITTVLSDNAEGTRSFFGPSPWAVSTEASFSPTRGYSDSPGGSYLNNTDTSLTQTAAVPLGDFVPSLTFYAKTALEAGYDYLYVEVSGDNGATWVRQTGSLTGTTAWAKQTVSLAPFAGKSVLVRFRMIADDLITGAGVWLDDIQIGGDQLLPISGGPAPTPPAAPTSLTASVVSSSGIDLAWRDNSGDETSFKLERRAGSGAWGVLATPGADVTSYSDRGLTGATLYTYRVSAANAAGSSSTSNEAAATTLPNPPAAPAGLAATSGNASVGLTWSAVSGADTYRVKRSPAPGGPYTVIASGLTAASHTDTTVANGSTYLYVVTAVNPGGESDASNEVSATPQAPAEAVLPPTNLAARRGTTGVTLRWTQSRTRPLMQNRVYRSATSGGPYTLVKSLAPTTVWTDKTVSSRTTYYYVVTAVRTDGVESPYSNQTGITTGAIRRR